MSLSIVARWLRRPVIASAIVATGMLALAGASSPAKAQYYPYYPYYPYSYGYPYYRAPVVLGYPYRYGYRYGWGHRGYGWHHPAHWAWHHGGHWAWHHR